MSTISQSAACRCADSGPAIGRSPASCTRRAGYRQRRRTDQEARDLVDRLLRRRQADPHQRPRAQRLQPFERQREVAAALAGRERVDLVDDHAARRRQHAPARVRAEQHVQRLRRRHQDVRRPAQALAALLRRRVAGADGGADLDVGQAGRGELGADAGERRLEVEPDVVRQRLQRRHVDDRRLVGQAARLQALAHQRVERGQESGQRLARTGRRGDERVPAGMDRRPRGDLGRRRRGERAAEPGGDGGMEVFEEHHRAGAGSVGGTRDSTDLRSRRTPAATLQFRACRRISSRPSTGTAARPACGRRPPRVRSWPTSSSPSSPLRRSRPSWSASRRATASCPSRSSLPWPLSAPSEPSGPWAPSEPSPP